MGPNGRDRLGRFAAGELALILSERDELRALSEHLDDVRLDEAGRIAAQLHDDIAQRVAWAAMQLGAIGERDAAPSDWRSSVRAVADQLREALTQIDALCEQLRPPLPREIGLRAALEHSLRAASRRCGFRAHLELDPSLETLAPETAEVVYRICAEAIGDAERHTGASSCTVVGRVVDGVAELTVRDDGVGLDEPPRGLGSRVMRERARRHGGVVSFEQDGSGRGTCVRIRLPIDAVAGS